MAIVMNDQIEVEALLEWMEESCYIHLAISEGKRLKWYPAIPELNIEQKYSLCVSGKAWKFFEDAREAVKAYNAASPEKPDAGTEESEK